MNCPQCGKSMDVSYADYYSAVMHCNCGTSVRVNTVDRSTKPLTIRTDTYKDGQKVKSEVGPGRY